MTGQDLVNDVRSLIIEPNPAFFSDARMLALVNLAQNEYVRRTRVLEARAFTQTVANQPNYPVPADFLGSIKLFYNNQQNGGSGPIDAWIPLIPYAVEKMAQEFPNFLTATITGVQIPTRFYFIDKFVYLWATPTIGNVANNLQMIYERMPITLNTLADPLSIDDSLVPGVRAYVLWQLWEQDNEDVKAGRWQALFEMEVRRGRQWKKQRQLDSKVAVDIQAYTGATYSSWTTPDTSPSGINPLSLQ